MTNRKPKGTSSQVRQWNEGEPLSFAWWGCASWEDRRKYQTCDSDSRRMSLRLERQFEVLDDIISGKLVAWGFRDGAPLDDGPILVPAHLFPRDREDTADIDWSASSLRSSGNSFVRIRVAKPDIIALRKKRAKVPKIKQTERPLALPVPQMPAPVPPATRKQMGRPSVEKPLREVIQKLVEGGKLKGNSRKALIALSKTPLALRTPSYF